MKKLFFILLLASACHASGSKYNYDDPKLNDELTNVYNSIDNVFKNKVYKSTITLTSLSVSSITVTHIYGPFSNWVSYTPTFSAGWGTVPSQTTRWRRVGDTLEVHGVFQLGTVAGSIGTITLPSGLSIDTTAIAQGGRGFAGLIFRLSGANSSIFSADRTAVLFVDETQPTYVVFGYNAGSGVFNQNNVSAFFSTSELVTFDFRVPISGWSF